MSAVESNMQESVHEADDESLWYEDLHVKPEGFSKNPDGRFYGENSPNDPPAIDVDVKMASDIVLEDNSEKAEEAAELIGFDKPSSYDEVAVVAFNDGSTWHLPIKDWSNDHASMRLMLVDEFIRDIIQWKAVINGEDPLERLSKWESNNNQDNYDWVEDVEDTEMSEEQRKWFNNNAEWVDHLDRVVESDNDSVDMDADDDYSWENDW